MSDVSESVVTGLLFDPQGPPLAFGELEMVFISWSRGSVLLSFPHF